jgi:hypothetical protein
MNTRYGKPRWWAGDIGSPKGEHPGGRRKAFFFEKKKQKTFIIAVAD